MKLYHPDSIYADIKRDGRRFEFWFGIICIMGLTIFMLALL